MTKPLVRLAAVLVTMVAAQSWALTFETIHTFPANGTEGIKPWATLTVGPDRNLYGTSLEGGSNGSGTAFKITTAGTFTTLGSFQVGTTGRASQARMIDIGDGFLYGATSAGTGTAGEPMGTVFKLDPAGGANPITPVFAIPGGGTDPKIPVSLTSGETGVLHVLGSSPGGIWRVPLAGGVPTAVFNFQPSGDQGQFPSSIMRGLDGYLYGVTKGTSFVAGLPGRRGTVFRIAPNGTEFLTLKDCESATGMAPVATMVEGPDGTKYGAATAGGANGDGVIFKLSPAGEYSLIHSINDQNPTGDLLLASDGKLYGTSSNGGSQLYGSIFRLNTDGTGFQVIHSFTKTNGAYPKAGLVQADDGNLYGVTSEGGTDDKGTIFRIDLGLEPPPVNRAPVAIDDYGVTDGSTAVIVKGRLNDFDPDDELETLTVTIENQPLHGVASPDVGGQILYTPGASYAGVDEFTYRITDPDGLFAIGTVYISSDAPPAQWQPGVYNGLLNLDFDTDTPRGQLIINISESGAFTGKLFAGKKRLKVRGLFTENGTAVAAVKIPRKGVAILFLAPRGDNSLDVYFFGQEQWTGYLSKLSTESPQDKAKYTIALMPDGSNLPAGFGYGVARGLSNGLVVAVGKLGDGSKFVWGTTLVNDGGMVAIPVFNEPVKNGVFAGRFFPGEVTTFAATNMRWIRPPVNKTNVPYPSGFSGGNFGFMALYTPPQQGSFPLFFLTNQVGRLQVEGPLATTGLTGLFNLVGKRFVPNDDPNNPFRSLTFNRGTGLFSGKMKLGDKTVPYKGAVLQSLQYGFGYYTIDKATGKAAVNVEDIP